MKDFRGKVAVITGAASGIGRALADQCAQAEMRVVLADVEPAALARAEKEMQAAGATTLAVLTDVSKARDVEALAQKTFTAFGAAHLLFNNAGVSSLRPHPIWDAPLEEWEWLMNVNVWGVIHGIRAFVPRMIEQNSECHIVNTASIAGLMTGFGIYSITKHAVVALSEALHLELRERHAQIKVSVLCPAWVKTRILDAERNVPDDVPPASREADATLLAREQIVRQFVETGIPPEIVAARVLQAIRDEQFYILTHSRTKPDVQARMEAILQGTNPPSPWR